MQSASRVLCLIHHILIFQTVHRPVGRRQQQQRQQRRRRKAEQQQSGVSRVRKNIHVKDPVFASPKVAPVVVVDGGNDIVTEHRHVTNLVS